MNSSKIVRGAVIVVATFIMALSGATIASAEKCDGPVCPTDTPWGSGPVTTMDTPWG